MDYDAALEDSRGGWIRYVKILAMRHSTDPTEVESLNKRMCRGWCIGEEGFKNEMAKELSAAECSPGLEKEGLAELNSMQWTLLLEAYLRALGKTRKDIRDGGKSAQWKKAIASKMRESTSVTSAWLGEVLLMGPGRNVNSMVPYYDRKHRGRCEFAKKLDRIERQRR